MKLWGNTNQSSICWFSSYQTSEALEAIRYLACCKDAWHPRKSGAGFKWLGMSLPLEFSVTIPHLHLISINMYLRTCQLQGLTLSCARRKVVHAVFPVQWWQIPERLSNCLLSYWQPTMGKWVLWVALKKKVVPGVLWPDQVMLIWCSRSNMQFGTTPFA